MSSRQWVRLSLRKVRSELMKPQQKVKNLPILHWDHLIIFPIKNWQKPKQARPYLRHRNKSFSRALPEGPLKSKLQQSCLCVLILSLSSEQTKETGKSWAHRVYWHPSTRRSPNRIFVSVTGQKIVSEHHRADLIHRVDMVTSQMRRHTRDCFRKESRTLSLAKSARQLRSLTKFSS